MDTATEIARRAERTRVEAQRLGAAARTLGAKIEPSEKELDVGEAAVRAYRKGRSKPRIREEVKRVLMAARGLPE